MSKSDQGLVGPHRPLAPDDWNRVLAMSGFVKSLLICNVYSPVEILSLQVISAHLNLPTTTQLFPNLQYISWDGPLQNISAYCLNSFMGSALEEAHIRAVNDFEMAFFIQILSQNALSLKKCSFTITPGPGTPDSSRTNATLEKAGHLFRSLTSLRVAKIILSRGAFLTLARLLNLTNLTCFVERSEDPLNLPYENIDDLFPSLTTLDISLAHSSQWAIPFLQTCRIPKLTTITVRYVRYPWLSDMLSTVKALSSYDSLQEIDLHCIDSPASVPSQLLAPETVQPLLRCSSLRILRIQAKNSCGLDDNVLEDIGRALPHLSHLSLSIRHNLGNVTYRGLHALAIHCPHLAEVKVPLRFTDLNNNDLQSPRRLTPFIAPRDRAKPRRLWLAWRSDVSGSSDFYHISQSKIPVILEPNGDLYRT